MLKLVVDNTKGETAHEMQMHESDAFDLLAIVADLSSYDFCFGSNGEIEIRPSTACDLSKLFADAGVFPQTPTVIYLGDGRPAA